MSNDGERPRCDECGRTAAHTHRYDDRRAEADSNGDRYVRGHCLSCDHLGTLEDGEHCQRCLDDFKRARQATALWGWKP